MNTEQVDDPFSGLSAIGDGLRTSFEQKQSALSELVKLLGGEITKEEMKKKGLSTEILIRAIFINLEDLYGLQISALRYTSSAFTIISAHHTLLTTVARVLKDINPLLNDLAHLRKAGRVETLEQSVAEMKMAFGNLNAEMEKLPNIEDYRDVRRDMENLRETGLMKLQELLEMVKDRDTKRDDGDAS